MNERSAAMVMEYWAELRKGMRELIKAYEYARDIDVSCWEFAVRELDLLRLGLSQTDVYWLMKKGYVLCRVEVTGPSDQQRVFQETGIKHNPNACCIVLTKEGYLAFKQFDATAVPSELPSASDNDRPHWDSVRHELWFQGKMVKRFQLPSPNQERIIAAFEEESWLPRIDDPLPPVAGQDTRQRLHDTIRSLNRNQKNATIRFFGDGTGEGVRWECRNGDETH